MFDIHKTLLQYANSKGKSLEDSITELISYLPAYIDIPDFDTYSDEQKAYLALKYLPSTYEFKRDIYFELLNKLQSNRIIFLLGPRKCGKTVCLKQLNTLDDTIYIDFKVTSNFDLETIYNSIRINENVTYLIDEITYLNGPEVFINKLSELFSTYNSKVKFIITGSQSYALDYWGHIAFAGSAVFLTMNFLSYNEWLRYKHYDDPTAQNYNEFLLTVDQFYNMSSIEDYLKGCLDETIISNSKVLSQIYGNDCDLVSVEDLLNVCYMTLFTLHNHVNIQTFMSSNYLAHNIKAYFNDLDIDEKLKKSFIYNYGKVQSMSLEKLEQAFLFLRNCGLITITNVTSDLDDVIDLESEFHKIKHANKHILNVKNDLFVRLNFCITYPMFYVAIVKDIYQDSVSIIENPLLGSIVECHVRGLLPCKNALEYQPLNSEIDYVNTRNKVALEIKTTDSNLKLERFKVFDDTYRCAILTKSKEGLFQNVVHIPYFKFLAKKYQEVF